MDCEPFDVVVVPFPFTDKGGAKRRPALVVSSAAFIGHHGQVVLAMITSARQSDWPSDVRLEEWAAAGLTVPCRVRFKLFTLDRGMILKKVGTLSPHDRATVQRSLSQSLAVA